MGLEFEWDRQKAQSNLKKHKVSFEEAATIFGDPFSITISDPMHSAGESRFVTIGESLSRRTLVVGHTDRGNKIRIISARVATKHERDKYEEK